jgi:EmrB/QacA subfamily drug resistance transporter
MNEGLVTAVLAVAALAYGLLQSLLVPAVPSLEKSLDITASQASWLLTAFLLSAAVTMPIAGRIGDQYGKAKVLTILLGVLAVGSLISALSTTFGVMLIGRVLQGLAGGVFPLACGIIRDEFEPRRVTWGIGMMAAVLGLGGAIGIVLSGIIVEHLDYHWLYWIPMAMALAALVAVVVVIPESPVRAARGINWLGAVLMTGWLVALLVAVSEAPEWGWGSTRVMGLIVAAVVLFGAWVWCEARSTTPLIDMKMMRIRTVWTTNVSSLLLSTGMFGMFLLLPQFTQTPSSVGYGFSASVVVSGLFLLPNSLCMLTVAPMTGRLTTRFGSKNLMVAGGVFSAVAYFLICVLHASPWQVMLSSLFLGIGVGLGFPAMSNLVVEAVPFEQTSVAAGMNATTRSVGAAIGAAVATSIVQSTAHGGYPTVNGYTKAFLVLGVALVASTGLAFLIPSSRRPSVVLSESHPALTAEAEAVIGPIAFTPEVRS